MKNLKSLMFLSIALIGLASCGKQETEATNNNDPRTVRTASDSPAPYPVAESERTAAVNELMDLRAKMSILEGQLIAPAQEDMHAFSNFLKNSNTGLMRIFPRTNVDGTTSNQRKPLLISGGGSYYSFKDRKHDYGQGNDIQYSFWNNSPEFRVGFAGVDFGFFGQLGKVDINQVTENHPAVSFALSYQSLNGRIESFWRSEQRKWSNGVMEAGTLFKDRVEATIGSTYVVRSVIESRYDIVAVFQVVRRDPTDGSLIIAWKLFREFEKPVLSRN